MKQLLLLPLAAFASILITSCGSTSSGYTAFKARKDYKKTYDSYKNTAALAKANPSKTKIRVDFSDQRMQLLEGDTVLVDAPCTTGKYGKRTPHGTFRISQKKVAKRSTIFGTCYRHGKRVYGGDRRKYHGRYDRYVGAALPYWQRIGSQSNGLHASKYVKRHPGSNGCVRLQPEIAKLVFSKTRVGTPITITQ